MVKENIPQTEEVRELEPELNSEEEQRLTSKKKKENQEYILANLEKYVVDIHGNFFHIDEDMIVNEDERVYIPFLQTEASRLFFLSSWEG